MKNFQTIANQAQYEVALQCQAALEELLCGIVSKDSLRETKAREALDLSLQAMRVATEITGKLQEVSEAATSPAAEKFKRPPLQTEEETLYLQLMGELKSIDVGAGSWYTRNKDRVEQVISPQFRTCLFDEIRAKI